MKFKTNFGVLCLVLVLLSIGLLDVHAASCTSYYSDYYSKVDAFNSAMNKLQRINVAVIKATPYASVPNEWKHLEDEYDSDPTGFYKTLEGMGVALPGYVSGPLSAIQLVELRKAKTKADAAYISAEAAQKAAEKALEDCTGMSVDTIWCERGADCQMIPGVQGLPKAHFVFDCPDKISGLLGIKRDCPGTW